MASARPPARAHPPPTSALHRRREACQSEVRRFDPSLRIAPRRRGHQSPRKPSTSRKKSAGAVFMAVCCCPGITTIVLVETAPWTASIALRKKSGLSPPSVRRRDACRPVGQRLQQLELLLRHVVGCRARPAPSVRSRRGAETAQGTE